MTYRLSTWDPVGDDPDVLDDPCAWNLRASGLTLGQLRAVIREYRGWGYSEVSMLVEREEPAPCP